MSEFLTIKNIIRLFTLSLLALWLAQCLFSAQQSAKVMSDHRQIMQLQDLYGQGIKIRQMLQFFYVGEGRLPEPEEYQDLECAHPFARCPFREWEGEFYVRKGQYWLAIIPVETEDDLEFQCRVNKGYQGDSQWRPPLDCEAVDRPLPFYWPTDERGEGGAQA